MSDWDAVKEDWQNVKAAFWEGIEEARREEEQKAGGVGKEADDSSTSPPGGAQLTSKDAEGLLAFGAGASAVGAVVMLMGVLMIMGAILLFLAFLFL